MPWSPTPTTCPVCGARIDGALVDHGIASHGVTRPPVVAGISGLLGLVAVLCGWQALVGLKDLVDVFSLDEFGRIITMLFALVFLVLGAYAAALGYIALSIWRGDRVGRVLAYAACAPVAVAGLGGADGDLAFVVIAVVALAVCAALSLLPDVTAWFTGPFAPRHDEPSAIVASRALVAWSGFLAGVGAMAFLVIATIDSDKWLTFVAYTAGAGCLLSSVQGLMTGSPQIRIRVSAGAGLVVVATLLAGNTTFSDLAILGPAVVAAGILWLVEEASSWFGGGPLLVARLPTPGRPASPDPGPGAWSGPTSAPLGATPPTAPLPSESGWAVEAPTPDDDDPALLRSLPPPAPTSRVVRPAPGSVPHAGPAPAPLPPVVSPPVVTPLPSPAAPSRTAVLSEVVTTVAANRAALLLQVSGARVVAATGRAAWLEVPGARIVVEAGSTTRVRVESADAARGGRIADVVQRSLALEDPSAASSQTTEAPPALPGPQASPGADWYADPYAAAGLRWWDGARWTAHTHPA
jgi:hypothetical protein